MKIRITASHRLALGTLAAALLAAAPLTNAQANTQPSTATRTTLPAEQQYQGIRYTTGGVASDEAAAFRRALHGYPLAIELLEKQKSGKREEFTADAKVRIGTPAGKEVFAAQAQGPFMLVRLEPGTYDITAALGGHTLHRKHVVIAKGKTAQAIFEFPAGTG